MRRAFFLVLACAALVLVWIARTPSGRVRRAPQVGTEEGEPARAIELAALPTSADQTAEGDDGAQTSSARRAGLPASRKTRPAALRAPVKGRLVVAESGDPIEAVLSLRLRTIDLQQNESLVTTSAGTFVSRAPFPRVRLLALLKDEEGFELVDHEAPFDPASEDEWLVRVPDARWPTFATGRVVDRRGTPLDEVQVSLVGQRAELPFAQDRCDGNGLFQLEGLRAGPYRLRVEGYWSRFESEVLLRTGPNGLGDLVLAEPASAEVRVHVVLEEPDPPMDAWFELREESSGRLRRLEPLDGSQEEDGSWTIRLGSVPSGRYELSVHAFDGRAYEPARLSVSPPATVEFRARGAAGAGTLFRASDARTGEPIFGFVVYCRFGRTWAFHAARQERLVGKLYREEHLEEVRSRSGFDSWVLCADGYQARAGTFAGAGPTIEVALEPGWSELYQFEDAEGDRTAPLGQWPAQDPPVIAGVEVLADGQPAGTSDGQGFLLLGAERQPESIEFRLPGWRVVRENHLGSLRTVVLVRAP